MHKHSIRVLHMYNHLIGCRKMQGPVAHTKVKNQGQVTETTTGQSSTLFGYVIPSLNNLTRRYSCTETCQSFYGKCLCSLLTLCQPKGNRESVPHIHSKHQCQNVHNIFL